MNCCSYCSDAERCREVRLQQCFQFRTQRGREGGKGRKGKRRRGKGGRERGKEGRRRKEKKKGREVGRKTRLRNGGGTPWKWGRNCGDTPWLLLVATQETARPTRPVGTICAEHVQGRRRRGRRGAQTTRRRGSWGPRARKVSASAPVSSPSARPRPGKDLEGGCLSARPQRGDHPLPGQPASPSGLPLHPCCCCPQ